MRGRSIVVWSLSLALLLACGSVASAAPPQEHSGFWIRIAVGAGSGKLTCFDCDGRRATGAVGHIALGGTLGQQLLVGVETNGWSKRRENVTANLYNIMATATFYPSASSGFFLKAGGGAAFSDNDFHEGARTLTLDFGHGFGVVAGAGYDVRIRRNVSITPAASFWYGRDSPTTLFSDPLSFGWRHNVVDFTVGITFH